MEQKKHDEHKDNTGIIIGIIVIGVLLIGLLAYLMSNGKDDVKDAIDKTGDMIENITDNDQKTAADVAGSYQAKYNLNNDELDTTGENEEYIELLLSEDGTASLVMTSTSKDIIRGTFSVNDNSIIINTNANNTTDDNQESGTGNASESNNSSETDNDSTTTNSYEFMINADDTLSYNTGDNDVTLTKVDNANLKYIK